MLMYIPIGGALQRLLEAVAEAKKLEVENSHQWKQTKNLLKYIKNQERESVKTERLVFTDVQHCLYCIIAIKACPKLTCSYMYFVP